MNGTQATDKQIDYLLSLASKVSGQQYRYLSQARRVLGVSSSQLNRGLTKTEASALIDQMKSRLGE